MQTAPARGRLADEKSGVQDNVLFSKPQGSPQQKSHAARQRLVRLTARLDALATWRDDLLERVADVDARLWEPNWHFSSVYGDEVEDLIDGVRAWRLAAARVVVDIVHQDDMRREV